VEAIRTGTPAGTGLGSGVLAIGFGTTVAMWAVGYVGRLPAVLLAPPVLLAMLVVCLLAGGVLVGRWTGGGWRAGLCAGLLAGLLNLLVLGSLLTGDSPNEIVPSALIWVPGSILLSGLVAGLGAGALGGGGVGRGVHWPAVLVRVAIGATFLLLAVGGLVTSKEAGLAVVDWPNSYGYNMFLYPLSRMTGGVYYEHAHRLFGALVGLTTLVTAVYLQRFDSRAWIRRLGWLALAMVVVQGILGGLRVTGSFTLSTAADDMAPSLTLAILHGVFGQVFFATLVALGAFTSAGWVAAREVRERPSAGADRVLGGILVALLIVQLVLGAIQRHTQSLLMVHVAMAAVVAPLALHVGFRSWGLNPDEPLLKRLGLGLIGVVILQVILGIGALSVTWGAAGRAPEVLDVTLTTLHQWCGALLLALAVLTQAWSTRLVSRGRGT
jgi:cytochrome c oxidase assembly protein subunit 15